MMFGMRVEHYVTVASIDSLIDGTSGIDQTGFTDLKTQGTEGLNIDTWLDQSNKPVAARTQFSYDNGDGSTTVIDTTMTIIYDDPWGEEVEAHWKGSLHNWTFDC